MNRRFFLTITGGVSLMSAVDPVWLIPETTIETDLHYLDLLDADGVVIASAAIDGDNRVDFQVLPNTVLSRARLRQGSDVLMAIDLRMEISAGQSFNVQLRFFDVHANRAVSPWERA